MPRASASSSRAAASAKAKERSACAAASSAYADRAAVARDRRRDPEVERELVDDPVAPALGQRLQRLAHTQVQGCRAERAQPLVDRPAQQLVPHAVHEARVPDLVEHPGAQALVERGRAAPRRPSAPPPAGPAARCRAGSRRSAAGARPARASGAATRSAITSRTLSGIVTSAGGTPRDLPVEHVAPHLADQERVAVGQPDELLGELVVRIRARSRRCDPRAPGRPPRRARPGAPAPRRRAGAARPASTASASGSSPSPSRNSASTTIGVAPSVRAR